MVSVMIVDDDPLVRRGVRALLEREKDIVVIGEARDGLDAISKVSLIKPDLVVMDVQMPRLDGVKATERIKQENPSVHILMVAMTFDVKTVQCAMANGAEGYVAKIDSYGELVHCIHAVRQGKRYYSRTITEALDAESEMPI